MYFDGVEVMKFIANAMVREVIFGGPIQLLLVVLVPDLSRRASLDTFRPMLLDRLLFPLDQKRIHFGTQPDELYDSLSIRFVLELAYQLN